MTAGNRFNKWSWRVYPVWFALSIALIAIIARLVQLQLVDAEHGRDFLQQQGDARVLRNEKITASRGEIVDRNGELLAFSTPVKSLWANPSLVNNEDSAVKSLALALEMPVNVLRKKLAKNDHYVYLRRQLAPNKADAVLAKKFPGVFAKIEYKRFYPAGEVASHLVGFTDVDDRGQEGIELAYQDFLQAEFGLKQVMKNARRDVIKDIKLIKAASPGQRLTLSIDMKLQYAAYRELKAAVTNYKAHSGSLVILDAKTSEVLALVNQPSYNANDRRQLVPENMRNRAMIDLFEPGSTVKPFTVAAALESGDFVASTIIDTSPGYIRIGSNTVFDSHNYGPIDLATILRKSSNVGTTKIALDLDIDQLQGLFSRVGLGEYCATGFPGEQAGYLPNHQQWKDIEKATLSFGHGLSVNTLQLARAYAVIASDGIKRPVSLLRLDDDTKNSVLEDRKNRVMSSSVAREVREMMVAVVETGGTGFQAHIPGYSVAGKTGTAHKVGASGYESNRYRATFAGIAPSTDPRLVVVVTINDPRGEKYFGGEIAAPVFSRVMQAALRLMNVPPDRLDELGKLPVVSHHIDTAESDSVVGIETGDQWLVSPLLPEKITRLATSRREQHGSS